MLTTQAWNSSPQDSQLVTHQPLALPQRMQRLVRKPCCLKQLAHLQQAAQVGRRKAPPTRRRCSAAAAATAAGVVAVEECSQQAVRL